MGGYGFELQSYFLVLATVWGSRIGLYGYVFRAASAGATLMTTPGDALAVLQDSLNAAVKASCQVPKDERPKFIGAFLLRAAAGEPATAGGPSELPASERSELALVIERAVNDAPDLSLRAVGEALCGPREPQQAHSPAHDGPAVANAKLVFQAVDKDASGFVDKAELREHVVAHVISQGLMPSAAEAEEMTAKLFATLDADADGRIAVDEWVRAFAASELQRQQGRGSQEFEGAQ